MQTIPIDFSSIAPLPPIRAMQGDAYSRFVQFELWEGGAPYTIPEGAAYQIGYRLAGGLEGAYDTIPLPGGSSRPACVAEGSTITSELAEVLTVDGSSGQLVLVITGPDGYKLHSWEVPLQVGAASGAPVTDPSLDGLGELTTAAAAKAQAAAAEAKASADRAAASEPAGAAERAEKAAQAAQTAQGKAEDAVRNIGDSTARAEAAAIVAEAGAAAVQTAKADALGAVDAARSAALSDVKAAGQEVDKAVAAAQTAKAGAESSAAAAASSAERAEGAAASLDLEAIKAELIPPSTVLYFATAAPPEGWLACNGAAVSRAAYAALFGAIGTTYGGGDGSTTFSLPDLRDRVAWGGTGVGTVKSAGLPNIKGTFYAYAKNGDNSDGAFTRSDLGDSDAKGDSGPYTYNYKNAFDASKSSSIYGSSATVQPPALTLLPCIKY